jgi:hypothetical protein
MLHETIIVLATAAALTGGLTADAFALATARSSWCGWTRRWVQDAACL